MKVRATKLGYYDHLRRKVGEVFEMEKTDYAPVDKEGKPICHPANHPNEDLRGKPRVCSWVEVVDETDEQPKYQPKKPQAKQHVREVI